MSDHVTHGGHDERAVHHGHVHQLLLAVQQPPSVFHKENLQCAKIFQSLDLPSVNLAGLLCHLACYRLIMLSLFHSKLPLKMSRQNGGVWNVSRYFKLKYLVTNK